jgi:hypothetical protein
MSDLMWPIFYFPFDSISYRMAALLLLENSLEPDCANELMTG